MYTFWRMGLQQQRHPLTDNCSHLVRNYHKAFYRPQNLCLIVAGKVDTEELFRAIAAVERKIVAKRDHVPIGCSPWSSPPPEFAETSVKVSSLF